MSVFSDCLRWPLQKGHVTPKGWWPTRWEKWWVFRAEGWEYYPFISSFLLSGCELPTDDPSWQLNEHTDPIHYSTQFLFTISIGISCASMWRWFLCVSLVLALPFVLNWQFSCVSSPGSSFHLCSSLGRNRPILVPTKTWQGSRA